MTSLTSVAVPLISNCKYLPSISTVNVSPPLFLVNVTIPLLLLKVAPLTNSFVFVNDVIYPTLAWLPHPNAVSALDPCVDVAASVIP